MHYPELPHPFDPYPENWLSTLRNELDHLRGERIVLCHSLGTLLWLLHARSGAHGTAERVVLVAPPCTDEVEPVVRFRPDGVTPAQVQAAATTTRIVCAPSGDPYFPAGAPTVFGDLVPDLDLIDGGGHLNTDAGYGPWPAVEAWALGEREDVEAR